MKPVEEIIKEADKKNIKTEKELSRIIKSILKSHNFSRFPSKIEILKFYRNLISQKEISKNPVLEKILQTRKTRSISGVSVVSVLTKPYPCPGKCIYCPEEEDVPKSYLSSEPAVMRAILTKYNPKKQIKVRLRALEEEGHPTSKIEMIILGGTFSALPNVYQRNFIKDSFGVLNKKDSTSLEIAQKINEKTHHRMVGLTIETRPDFINVKEIKKLRRFGVTRVELGVQSVWEDVLKINKRGHKTEHIKKATQLLKDAGFKICYHMMPNLPGSSKKKDLKAFEEIFDNQGFKPDFLKIYPCLVLKNSELFKLWKEKKYKPYSTKELIKLLRSIKKKVPLYVRIQRLVRDVPSPDIISGNKATNLRQILKNLDEAKCRCIRCREVKENNIKKAKLWRTDYSASRGKEIFLSFEDKNQEHLSALLRLRIPSQYFSGESHFIKTLENSAIIREVHTYGPEVEVGKYSKKVSQHKGLGKRLISEAEKIAKKEFGVRKMAIISGVGARDYYRKLGYNLEDGYMVKKL